MNTACWIPDLFMKRVEAREPWTLFRSSDVPDLHELYGARVRGALPAAYEQLGRGRARSIGERIEALELWKQMLADALRDRPSVDHLQGPVQRPQPAGPRRRHPLLATSAPRSRSTPATRRRRSATSARSSSTGTSRRRRDRPREAARDRARRRARARQRDRHQLLPDRGRPRPPTSATARSASA